MSGEFPGHGPKIFAVLFTEPLSFYFFFMATRFIMLEKGIICQQTVLGWLGEVAL